MAWARLNTAVALPGVLSGNHLPSVGSPPEVSISPETTRRIARHTADPIAYAVEAVPPRKKFRAMVDWATIAPRLTLFRAARNHRCQANRAARAAVNSTGNGATTRREAWVPSLPASPSSIPLATVPQAHGNDNCLLSLMPSAGRTHKKLKKKLALVWRCDWGGGHAGS